MHDLLNRIVRLLCRWLGCHRKQRLCIMLITNGGKAMQFLAVGQTIPVFAQFVDTTQTPPVSDPLDSPAVWSVDDPSKISIQMVQDGTAGNGDGISTANITGLADGPFNLKCVGISDGVSIPGTEPGTVGGDNAVVMGYGTPPKPPAKT